MPSCNTKQHGGELGSAKLRKQKGAGHGFMGNEQQGRGTYATTGYSDCCPPKVDTKDHRINSIGGILSGGANCNKKGGAYPKKLSKKVKRGLKRGSSGMRKLSKKMSKKAKKISKKVRKMLRGGSKKSDHRDPSVRKFGCRQDKWTPDCI